MVRISVSADSITDKLSNITGRNHYNPCQFEFIRAGFGLSISGFEAITCELEFSIDKIGAGADRNDFSKTGFENINCRLWVSIDKEEFNRINRISQG